MNRVVGHCDLLWITLDTLRYDVACAELAAGHTPHLAAVLPEKRWEKRHTPGNFTFAAHAAFFAGFLPTPEEPGPHPRPFALRFPGSESITPDTCVLDGATIVEGLAARGYRTVCIGGVGFFNPETPLGRVLPSLFQESHWNPALGVRDPHSTQNQVRLAERVVEQTPRDQRLFLFLNVSALHQPNHHYVPGATADSLATHAAALRYVDLWLGPLFEVFRKRGPTHAVILSDHGTTYGEDGYHGHRLAHPLVWTVPYAEFFLGGFPG